MLVKELEEKYQAAQEKVNKRLNTIDKVCSKLNINKDLILNEYYQTRNLKNEYFRSSESREIISKYITSKETRDSNNNWIEANYDYNQKINQLEDNLPKLFDLERIANNWKIKLDIQINKDNAPKIQVLMDFLNNWESKVKEFITNAISKQINLANEYHEFVYNIITSYPNYNSYENEKIIKEDLKNKLYEKYGVKSRYNVPDVYDVSRLFIPDLTRDLLDMRFERTEENDDYYYSAYGNNGHQGKYILKSFDYDKLNKILEEEKQNKYFDLCNRISDVVGEIQDCSNLSIGRQNGEINGIVVGNKGKAKVETISAGGYNIQCFHYRVLVHELKF